MRSIHMHTKFGRMGATVLEGALAGKAAGEGGGEVAQKTILPGIHQLIKSSREKEATREAIEKTIDESCIQLGDVYDGLCTLMKIEEFLKKEMIAFFVTAHKAQVLRRESSEMIGQRRSLNFSIIHSTAYLDHRVYSREEIIIKF